MKVENEKSRVYRYKTLEEIAEALVKYNSLGYEREYDDDFFHIIIFILMKTIFLLCVVVVVILRTFVLHMVECVTMIPLIGKR